MIHDKVSFVWLYIYTWDRCPATQHVGPGAAAPPAAAAPLTGGDASVYRRPGATLCSRNDALISGALVRSVPVVHTYNVMERTMGLKNIRLKMEVMSPRLYSLFGSVEPYGFR